MKWVIATLFFFFIIPSIGQPIPSLDIQEFQSFTVYKSDTFNTRDELGLKQGTGFTYHKTTEIFPLANSNLYSNHGFKDTVIFRYYNPSFGKYLDDKKIGSWKSYWPNEKKSRELFYDTNGNLISIKLFYETGELMLNGPIAIDGDLFLFDQYTKSGHHIESYWFYLHHLDLFNY